MRNEEMKRNEHTGRVVTTQLSTTPAEVNMGTAHVNFGSAQVNFAQITTASWVSRS